MTSVLKSRQADANVSMDVDGGYAQTERKLRKLRTKSPRIAVGSAQRGTEEMKSVASMNGSHTLGNAKPKSQDVAKDEGVTLKEERLQALRSELWKNDPLFQQAGKAYLRLAKRGCDMGVAMGYVGRVAGYNSGNMGRRAFGRPTGGQMSREIRAINRGLKKLGKRAARLRRIWGFWECTVDANAFHAPEELVNIAARLSCISTEGFGDWFPQREAIIDLFELVRKTTGRPHYAQVCLLINAQIVWRAEKKGRAIEKEFDPDSLKMIVRRDKQRQAAIARKRAKVKKRLKSLRGVFTKQI
jgi:hypothetical protein